MRIHISFETFKKSQVAYHYFKECQLAEGITSKLMNNLHNPVSYCVAAMLEYLACELKYRYFDVLVIRRISDWYT